MPCSGRRLRSRSLISAPMRAAIASISAFISTSVPCWREYHHVCPARGRNFRIPFQEVRQIAQSGDQAAAFFGVAVRHVDHFLSDVSAETCGHDSRQGAWEHPITR